MLIYLTFNILVAIIASASLTSRVLFILSNQDPIGSMYGCRILTTTILFIFYFILSPLVMFVLFSTNKSNVFCDVLAKTLKD